VFRLDEGSQKPLSRCAPSPDLPRLRCRLPKAYTMRAKGQSERLLDHRRQAVDVEPEVNRDAVQVKLQRRVSATRWGRGNTTACYPTWWPSRQAALRDLRRILGSMNDAAPLFAENSCVRSVGGAPAGPIFHQLSPPFEHITAPIGRFYGIADRMTERHFGQLIGV
jgi:hypothetical protein